MTRMGVVCGVLLLGLVATPCVLPSGAAGQPAATRVKWEYKVLSTSAIEKLGGEDGMAAGLNKLGEDGWELVAIDPGHVPPPVKLPRYVFKRPK
jgi:hypothetical protein